MAIKLIHLEVIVIVILLILDIAIFINGKSLKSDNCKVNFKSEKIHERWGNIEGQNISVKLTDLYGGLKNGKCIVSWSKTEGYQFNP